MAVVAGILGCLFGVLGILTLGIVFVPLAIVCTVVGFLAELLVEAPVAFSRQ